MQRMKVIVSVLAVFFLATLVVHCNKDSDNNNNQNQNQNNNNNNNNTLIECDAICQAMIGPQCTNGPPDASACGAVCGAIPASCDTEFDAWRGCIGLTPTFTCDASDNPMVAGCTAEASALDACTP